MYDGHNVFYDSDATYGKSWGNERICGEGKILRLLSWLWSVTTKATAVWKNIPHGPLTPGGLGHIRARGDIYMEWMINVLKPMVDRRFRTRSQREYTYICGSSMGGLMALYGVCRFNHIFSRAAALSPSLWVAPGKAVNMIREAGFAPETIVYMDYGSEEMKNHPLIEDELKKTAGMLLDRQVYLCLRIVPGGQHCEASWERQIPVFMRCLQLERRQTDEY